MKKTIYIPFHFISYFEGQCFYWYDNRKTLFSFSDVSLLHSWIFGSSRCYTSKLADLDFHFKVFLFSGFEMWPKKVRLSCSGKFNFLYHILHMIEDNVKSNLVVLRMLEQPKYYSVQTYFQILLGHWVRIRNQIGLISFFGVSFVQMSRNCPTDAPSQL